MELFGYTQKKLEQTQGPLAARMRPRTLDEYIGQEHILAPGRLLRRAIQADQLSSLIFFGPPGTGKTTLASVIANTTRSVFITLNAVLSGVKELREVTDAARERYQMYQKRTILFVDEVHRWNKAQQDALLPWVENGTIILIGATTENPYFSVNKALVSRSRVFQLFPLTETDLRNIVIQAIHDPVRGYGNKNVELDEEAISHLIHVSNGDARTILNALELAIETTSAGENGQIVITKEIAEESIQKRAVLYDKEGDYHFDTISAFIKSLRGSDPDAALYWMAKMIYAGEEPSFIFRRMIIFASEDVGMADPHALQFVMSAAQAFDRVGMPEGRFMLGHAAIYLATAPKSNSVFAFFDALKLVEHERDDDIPNHLRDASRDHESFGHGKGYLYPHAYQDHWVAQQYLPASLQGRLFYSPGQLGFEKKIADEVRARREVQLAVAMASESMNFPQENVSYTPKNKKQDEWLLRASGNFSEVLTSLRREIYAEFIPARHSLILDLNGGDGLLTWEALRHVPEGGVWTIVKNRTEVKCLEEQAEILSVLQRPQVYTFEAFEKIAEEGIRFDFITGRNLLAKRLLTIKSMKQWLTLKHSNGTICLAENFVHDTQRLYKLIPQGILSKELSEKLAKAEESLYDELEGIRSEEVCAELASFNVQTRRLTFTQHLHLGKERVEGWFAENGSQGESAYLRSLRRYLNAEEINIVRDVFIRILGQTSTCPWTITTTLFIVTEKYEHDLKR